jgi:3-mercaptopyruvate sulfurtransferase SseA
VIGKGKAGKAEEGRLAFTLTYMGVKNVAFSALENFSIPLIRDPAPTLPNAETWKPELLKDFLITKKELRFLGQQNTAFPSVIDVRREKEYLRETNHVFNAINIPWEQFVKDNGTANFALKEKFKSLGLTENQRVAVIGDDGNSGALAAFVLYKMGFTKVGLFAGGYRAIVGSNSGN